MWFFSPSVLPNWTLRTTLSMGMLIMYISLLVSLLPGRISIHIKFIGKDNKFSKQNEYFLSTRWWTDLILLFCLHLFCSSGIMKLQVHAASFTWPPTLPFIKPSNKIISIKGYSSSGDFSWIQTILYDYKLRRVLQWFLIYWQEPPWPVVLLL